MTSSDRPVAPDDGPAAGAREVDDARSERGGDAPSPSPAPPSSPSTSAATAKSEKPGTDWWAEIKAIFWLIVAVLVFHSLIAKPFYIPSESMMPGLLTGDRLVVSKYPYGWSWVSPSFHILPRMSGRLLGQLPERGDVVIVTPPVGTSDYIKRVIGLPGDRIQMIAGQLIINGQRVRRERRPDAMIPIDANVDCRFGGEARRVRGSDGAEYCRLPIVRETLPNGRSYDTADTGLTGADDFPLQVIPPGHVWLMGDNRDHSADSRFPAGPPENGLGGPVPWGNIGGRAEIITFSLDGSSQYWNPISWFTALRSGRAGTSLHPERVAPQR